MAWEIRKMTEADANAVYAIACACELGSWSLDSYQAESKNPVAVYLVAETEDQIIGFIGIWCVVDEAQVMNVGVLEPYRGKGIGSALLNRAINMSQAMGCISMTLEVKAHNAPALHLYERSGFITEGRREAYYPDGSDGLLMRRHYD